MLDHRGIADHGHVRVHVTPLARPDALIRAEHVTPAAKCVLESCGDLGAQAVVARATTRHRVDLALEVLMLPLLLALPREVLLGRQLRSFGKAHHPASLAEGDLLDHGGARADVLADPNGAQ